MNSLLFSHRLTALPMPQRLPCESVKRFIRHSILRNIKSRWTFDLNHSMAADQFLVWSLGLELSVQNVRWHRRNLAIAFVLRQTPAARSRSADIPDRLLRAVRHALARLLVCLIVGSLTGYDEPEILSYAISLFCPTSTDGLQCASGFAQLAATSIFDAVTFIFDRY